MVQFTFLHFVFYEIVSQVISSYNKIISRTIYVYIDWEFTKAIAFDLNSQLSSYILNSGFSVFGSFRRGLTVFGNSWPT